MNSGARLRSQGFEFPAIPAAGGLSKTVAQTSRQFIALDGIKTSSVAVNARNVFVVQKQLGYVLTSDSLVSDAGLALAALELVSGLQCQAGAVLGNRLAGYGDEGPLCAT